MTQATCEARREAEGWVYVVDDDLSMREALSSLARSRGLRVKAFESARAFLEHSRPRVPSCLILDICLPGLTGPELHRQLERTRDTIPTIYITGNGDIPTAVGAMKAGAVEFLTKPFEHTVLLAAIQQCLAQWATQRVRTDEVPSVLEFESFRLDVAEQCVWRCADAHHERILLSPKAFTVLRYLVERAGRLVTENELLRAGWPNVFVQPEAVKHRLYEIRKALGDNSKAPHFIETLARRGYRFIAPVREIPAAADPSLVGEALHQSLPGRGPALALLRESLRLALRGERQLVFIEGELGVGNTALMDEFQRLAAIDSPGLRVAHGRCIEGCDGVETYYPILEAVESLCRSSSQILDIVGTHAPTWLVQFPGLLTDEHRRKLQQEILGATRERMLREIAQAIEAVSLDEPLLLILDDLQWADGQTLKAISALARRRTTAQLMLVATSHPVDGSISTHPLEALRHDLRARGLCRLVELEPSA
jgi:DNA-binding response OmpR family regulator